jgi:hypothetical protein
MHLALVGLWAKDVTHRLTFSLDKQGIISLTVTGISTAFAAVCALFKYISHLWLNDARSILRCWYY